MLVSEFEKGKLYKRSELHDQFGGNRQRGISPSAKLPVIFIFSGDSGSQYGYTDGWNEDYTIFTYTGEGQVGDQEFTMGNKALRDHIELSKDVFLFTAASGGQYKFNDQLTLINYEKKPALDRNGDSRMVISFTFESFTEIVESSNVNNLYDSNQSLEELKQIALDDASSEQASIQEKRVMIRKRSEAIKTYARKRAEGICEACEQPEPFDARSGSSLDVHHLYRLSDGGPDHPEHVAAICPNCHARIHRGRDGAEYNQVLIKKIREKERS